MAFNAKLIYCETKDQFQKQLDAEQITDTSIVFIKSTGELWTHGKLFAGNFVSKDSNKIALTLGGSSVELSKAGHTHSYLPLSGGTLTGALNFANNTWNKLGDDAYIGDHNVGNHLCIKAISGTTAGIAFFNSSDGAIGKLASANNTLQWNGTSISLSNHNHDDRYVNITGDTMTGPLIVVGKGTSAFNTPGIIFGGNSGRIGTSGDNSLGIFAGNNITLRPGSLDASSGKGLYVSTTAITYNDNKVWHAGNDGPNSGMNADLLDGLHAGSFMRGTWSSFSYFGMANSSGSDTDWIRTTKYGIIPYESGVSSALGTEQWRFETAYINSIYGNLNGYASSAGVLNLQGEAGSSTGTSLPTHVGMELYQYYNSGNGPTTYGNFLRIRGNNGGCGELFLGWQGDNNTNGIWYKSKRDVGSWGAWRQVAFTDSTVANADNADKLDGYHESDFFRARDYITSSSLNNFVERRSGTYNVGYGGYSGMLTVFHFGAGSVCGMEILAPHYDISQNLMVRYNVDNNRYTGWRTFAFTDSNVASADQATVAEFLSTHYAGGQQFNPSTYFSGGMGLKVAMTGVGNSTMGSHWTDTLWINGYSGGDVKGMCALHFSRQNGPRFSISYQNFDSSSYGTCYEVWTSYNFNPSSVVSDNIKWAMYKVTIGSSSVSYSKMSGNHNFISGSFRLGTGSAALSLSYPSGASKTSIMMSATGHHAGSDWNRIVYASLQPDYGSSNQIKLMLGDDSTNNDGEAIITFMYVG